MDVASRCASNSSPDGAPSCGALWGVTPAARAPQEVQQLETQLGRPFDFFYHYHDINDVIPTAEEKAEAADGALLHISLVPRDFSLADKNTIRWRDVANGVYDAALTRQARGIRSLRTRVFLTFDHEPDQTAKAPRGTAADYVAAWRHVHRLYADLGVDNVTWIWVMMGLGPWLDRAGRLWPGNNYVDWISWELYNHSGCRENATDPSKYTAPGPAMATAYKWLHADGPRFGIDPSKPIMISEAGSTLYPRDPSLTARWYTQLAATVQKYPQVKAVGLFDLLVDNCDFRFEHDATVLAAVKKAGQQPWFNAVPRSSDTD